MFLSKVLVRNFRNLRNVEARFSKGLNVIVGENNVGKTNLLDAIRIALGPSSTAGEPLRLTKEDRHRDAHGHYSADPIAVDLYFADLTPDEQAQFLEVLLVAAGSQSRTASIHFEWSWDEKAARWHARRWGGERAKGESAVPDEVLQSVPLTLLGALRDALVALSPGRSSRLGQLLRTVASDEQKSELEKILAAANEGLQAHSLITGVEKKIAGALTRASGPRLAQEAAVRATEPEFDRIANNLRLVLREHGQDSEWISELRSNGLGFNNLLYIATVLAELDAAEEAALPLLLVEEPEAHLHPQLQTLLAEYLTRGGAVGEHAGRVQTIVTTHSPTIAAHVHPSVIRVLHRDEQHVPRSASLSECGLDEAESRKLRRMLDVTRASMLFARAVILVEGITEALLLRALARRLGPAYDLPEASVAVVPMAGVDFTTFGKLFGSKAIQTRVAVLTDSDPRVDHAPGTDKRDTGTPARDSSGEIEPCERIRSLFDFFAGNSFVKVFPSKVTLEYDIAEAGADNALVLFDAWEHCYARGGPRTLRRSQIEAEPSAAGRALLLWRALCLGDPVHGKAEVAQELASRLEERDANGSLIIPAFTVPEYIENAIKHVLPNVGA